MDAVSVSIGLSVFQGDLDGNAKNDVVYYLNSGNLDLRLGVERYLSSRVVLGSGLSYHRLSSQKGAIEFINNAVTWDITSEYVLVSRWGEFLRVFSGVGLVWHNPKIVEGEDLVIRGYNTRLNQGQVALAIPMGFMIQKRLRVTSYMVLSDFIDGASAPGRANRDFIAQVVVGFRFEI